jgi:ankyrin repeat protein
MIILNSSWCRPKIGAGRLGAIYGLIALMLIGGAAVADQKINHWREAIKNSDVATLRQLAESGIDVNTGMRRLIALGADIDQVNRSSGNALMYAAQYGQRRAAELLIQRGANINHRAGKGWSALMVAVLKGRTTMVEFLLENRADPNMRDVLGWTPLMRAAGSANQAIVDSLIIRPDIDLNARNHHGQNALHIATIAGATDIAAALLNQGIEVKVMDNDGNTPLAIAEHKAHAQLAQLLKKYQ